MAWMLCWSVSGVSLTLLMTKIDTTSLPMFLFVKNALGLLYFAPLWFYRTIPLPSKRVSSRYLLQSIVVYAAMWCTYRAYKELPNSTATAVGFIEPILSIMLSVLFLGTTVSWRAWFFIVLAYLGVMIMSYPVNLERSQAFLLVLAANFLAALSRLITQWLTSKQTSLQIAFYGYIGSVVASFLGALFYLDDSLPPHFYFCIVQMSLLSFINQYAYIAALSLNGLERIGPMTYMKLLVAIPTAYFFLGEVPRVGTLVGGALVLVANYKLLNYQDD